MPKIRFVLPDGTERSIDATNGESLMQEAVSSGIEGIVGSCGGATMCATCHVYVDAAFEGELSEITPFEDDMLNATASERRPNSRLGCMITIEPALDGLTVFVPEKQ